MNREIKFRAWTNTEMTTSDDYKDMTSFWDDCRDCKIMQFTGLLDKNGKKIYEGDIVRISINESETTKAQEYIAIIQWNNLKVGYSVIDKDKFDWDSWHNLEIIGNIYENPELITT